jgi:hypothetical protein
LKLYIYGYLNRVQSSRRLEREACRNVEVMWLAGRLVPLPELFLCHSDFSLTPVVLRGRRTRTACGMPHSWRKDWAIGISASRNSEWLAELP